MTFADYSKRVGWDARRVAWPSLETVRACKNPEQIITWQRFLPLATNDSQREIISEVVKRFSKLK